LADIDHPFLVFKFTLIHIGRIKGIFTGSKIFVFLDGLHSRRRTFHIFENRGKIVIGALLVRIEKWLIMDIDSTHRKSA